MAYKVEYKIIRPTGDGQEVHHIKRVVEKIEDLSESALYDPNLEFLTIKRVKPAPGRDVRD